MWTAHLFQVTSGTIGPRLNFESLSWSIELNGIESISMKLNKSDLPAVNRNLWLSPWWAGVVIFYDGVPIVGGPILTRPSESFDTISLGCGGIRSVLQRRFVSQEQTNWDNLAKSNINYMGLSLGTIAKRIVAVAQQKPAGTLPITYATPDEVDIHERNYRGFNLQNINAHDVLTKLSNVINGPDIMFKPRLIRDNALTFDMYNGTKNDPRIIQKYTPVWDTTPTAGQVEELSVTTTGTYQASRVYSLGAGQDQGLLIKVATNEAPLQAQYPLLESVINMGNSENPTVVQGYAISNLWTNRGPLMEIQMTVRADGDIPLGQFWPGDLVEIHTKDWLALPDGKTQMRLLSITGDDSNRIKISLQKEEKFS